MIAPGRRGERPYAELVEAAMLDLIELLRDPINWEAYVRLKKAGHFKLPRGLMPTKKGSLAAREQQVAKPGQKNPPGRPRTAARDHGDSAYRLFLLSRKQLPNLKVTHFARLLVRRTAANAAPGMVKEISAKVAQEIYDARRRVSEKLRKSGRNRRF